MTFTGQVLGRLGSRLFHVKHSEVMSGVAGAGTHLIVGEDDIQAPMQAVLDSPV
jgi:hypothetical protein